MARMDEVGSLTIRIGERTDRHRLFLSGDTRSRFNVVDRNSEGRSEWRRVVLNHLGKV